MEKTTNPTQESEISSSFVTRQDISSVSLGTENPSLQITLHKLNGRNFLQWSQSVTLFLRGKGRLGYITGETKSPDVSDPSYPQWDAENSMVHVCSINSMDVDIGRTYLFLPFAKEL